MNPAAHFERSSKEYLILSLSLVSSVALFPFIVHRLITEDWGIAIFDLALMASTLTLFLYVYKTRKTDIPSLVLALVFMAGEVTSVAIKGSPQLVWTFPCTVGIFYLTTAPRAVAINATAAVLLFSLIHSSTEGLALGAYVLALVATNIFTAIFAIRNSIQKAQLEELTLKDPLTGVHNRRAFENYLDEQDQIERSEEQKQSLIMIDIDHFKMVNDKHGHLAGDDTLVRMVTLIQTQLHSEEKLYRIGGEEYVIAPIKMDLDSTFDFADRLRKIIEHSNMNEIMGVTVSIGVATCERSEPAREWVKRADQALYSAKNSGRNQTQKAE